MNSRDLSRAPDRRNAVGVRMGKSAYVGGTDDSGASQTARRAIDAAMSEMQWQRIVEQCAEHHGWIFFHDTDSRRNRPGFPDLVLVRRGVILYVELKTSRGRLRYEQEVWRDALQAAGCDYRLWRPGDYAEMLATLSGEGA